MIKFGAKVVGIAVVREREEERRKKERKRRREFGS